MKWLPLASASLLLVSDLAIAQDAARPAPQARPGAGQAGRPGGGQRPPVTRPPNPGNGQRPPITRPPVARPPHNIGHRPPNFRPIPARPFRYPHGYHYRRWTIGLLLPSLFLSANYYFDNYAAYGFGPPPRGYRWVRYGPDLLLVNVRSGRIADVVYGAFR